MTYFLYFLEVTALQGELFILQKIAKSSTRAKRRDETQRVYVKGVQQVTKGFPFSFYSEQSRPGKT